MIEVTDEMLQVLKDSCKFYISDADAIERIIELHEANKQHLVTKDVMTNCVHVLPMDFVKDLSNGTQNLKHLSEKERDAIVRCIANAVVESCNPTQEPLSDHFLLSLADECTTQFFNGVHQNATIHFARAIEQAHGIGVTND